MANGRKTGGRQPGSLNKSTVEIKALAREYGHKAILSLAQMSGLVAGYSPAESETARIAAIKEILDRGYGKATQPLSGDPDGPPLAVDFRWADAMPASEVIEADESMVVSFVTIEPPVNEC